MKYRDTHQIFLSHHRLRSILQCFRQICRLDLILILNAAHLRHVLLEYIDDYYNVARPHQGIEQGTPLPRGQPINTGTVRRRKLLGGILNDYYRASGSPSTILN